MSLFVVGCPMRSVGAQREIPRGCLILQGGVQDSAADSSVRSPNEREACAHHQLPAHTCSECSRSRTFLTQVGIKGLLDIENIDFLDDFPDRIQDAIGRRHSFLAWWLADYGDSDYCAQEFRHAWQHGRRRFSDIARRIWM